MIVEEADDAPVGQGDIKDLTVRTVLLACAAEMQRCAGAMASMDRALGSAMEDGLGPHLFQQMQEMDRLRQEAEAVAALLNSVVGEKTFDTSLDVASLRLSVPMEKQWNRILSVGNPRAAPADRTPMKGT